MCIRDSAHCPRLVRVIKQIGQGRRQCIGVAKRGEQTVYAPVSYTHLQAHETVLDLVCRLLLEKKKTSIYDIASGMFSLIE